ncbi:MAG: hypothetical protein UZ12_BCD005000149 [Bacteroidetes bacterium OLB12]|nr:MAG: hypothetical protein UZ12_BCD005000149 [Bacteroidetes bacterium OLB12]
MKKNSWIIVFALITVTASAQEHEFEKRLKYFNKITVSPKIHLILTQGDQESIKLTYSNIDAGQINVAVEGDKLKIYLDDARIIDKREYYDDSGKRSIYHNAHVTAHITFRELRLLEIRGDQDVSVNHILDADHLLIRAYGSAQINIDSLQAKSLKVVAYGENRIRFKSGSAPTQRYVLYGENRIDSRNLDGHNISSNIYGEGRLTVNASDEVRINAIGEPEINVSGTSFINKGLVLGRASIHKENK